MSFSCSLDNGFGFGGVFLGSPLALRFSGRDGPGVAVGASDECRELSLDTDSAIRGGGREFFDDAFRGFATAGGGVGLGGGSAFDRILEKAIGSAGLLGV